MSGWLSHKCREELRDLGYIAVPKECVREFHVETIVDAMEMLHRHSFNRASSEADGFDQSLRRHQAIQLGYELLKQGFFDLELFEPKPEGPPYFRHRASIHALRPRTVK